MNKPTKTQSQEQINWNASREEIEVIYQIAKRFIKMKPDADMLNVIMDVTACHLNGTKLDIEKLLAFDDFNFAHDIVGIANHINRKTGKIERFFLPRSAR